MELKFVDEELLQISPLVHVCHCDDMITGLAVLDNIYPERAAKASMQDVGLRIEGIPRLVIRKCFLGSPFDVTLRTFIETETNTAIVC